MSLRRILCTFMLLGSTSALAGQLLVPTFPITSQRTIFLDITPAVSTGITVTSIDASFTVAGAQTVNIYRCTTGSYVNNWNQGANWALLASVNINVAAAGAPTSLPISPGLTIPFGTTQGLAISTATAATQSNVRYSTVSGAFSSPSTWRDSYVTLFSAHSGGAFAPPTTIIATPNTPRTFNGRINYTTPDTLAGIGSAKPATTSPGCSNLLTVRVTPQASPPSTGIAVTANLTSIGGSASQMLFDDGSNGDLTPNDGVFSYLATIPITGVSDGVKSIPFTVTDAQSHTYQSNVPMSLTVTSTGPQLPTLALPTPFAANSPGTEGLSTLMLAGAGRTCQLAFAASELGSVPTGAKIQAISFRLQASTTNNPTDWPPSDAVFSSYDIRLSKLAAGITVGTLSTTFANNIDNASAVLVRSGTLRIPTNSFGGGAAGPLTNPFNELVISFATPYVYTGGDLLVTISHTGHNLTSRFLDSLSNVITVGYGSLFASISATGYNAATGAATFMTTARFKFTTGLSATALASPTTVVKGCSTLLTVQPSPAPGSTNLAVSADLSQFGLSSQEPFFDDGTHGDAVSGDGIYSLSLAVSPSMPSGIANVIITVSDAQCHVDQPRLALTIRSPIDGTGVASPASLGDGCSTVLTVALGATGCQTSTNPTATADLSALNLSGGEPMYDDGTHGDPIAGDRVFTLPITVPAGVGPGNYTINVMTQDQEGHVGAATIALSVSRSLSIDGYAMPFSGQPGTNVKLFARPTTLACATSTGIDVTVDLSLWGGSPNQQLFDNGIAPDQVAGDGIYTGAANIPNSCEGHVLALHATDLQGRLANGNIVVLAAPASSNSLLYDNGPLITSGSAGPSGMPVSALQNVANPPNIPFAMGTFGFTCSTTFALADDFIICDPAGWNINHMTFMAYQTGSGQASTFTEVRVRIWDGVPNAAGSNIVFGDLTTNRLNCTYFTGIYRGTLLAPTDSTRPIMAIVANVSVSLPAGHYWVDYMLAGSGASGPFVPAVTKVGQAITGNGQQSNAGVYAPVADGGSATYLQGFPFLIHGTGSSITHTDLRGDMNCDGVVDANDVPGFVSVMLQTETNPGRIAQADLNDDGLSDADDIAGFEAKVIHP